MKEHLHPGHAGVSLQRGLQQRLRRPRGEREDDPAQNQNPHSAQFSGRGDNQWHCCLVNICELSELR